MEDEEAILEVVQEDQGILTRINQEDQGILTRIEVQEDQGILTRINQEDQGILTRIDQATVEKTPSLLSGLRLDVKKDSGYGSQGVLGLETLRVNFSQ